MGPTERAIDNGRGEGHVSLCSRQGFGVLIPILSSSYILWFSQGTQQHILREADYSHLWRISDFW